jgi:hypothetical protein
MTNFLKWTLIVLLCLVKSASAASNSTVLDPNAKPVQDLAIIVGMGDLQQTDSLYPETRAWYYSQLKEALTRRLPEIFAANGIPVRSTKVSEKLNFDEPWGDAAPDGGPSHYLVLNAYKIISGRNGQHLYFEASLWSAREQKKVWKAYPRLWLFVRQPLLRTQVMAAELLQNLRDDRVLTLPQAIPVDLAGEPITTYLIFTKDR